ncbi:MAG: glycosyltransferase [Patescibacteria group bacterium]
MLDINIVIVNWKMKQDIDRCLDSLFAEIKNSQLDILIQIVDNSGNSDGIKEMLYNKYPQVKYLDAGKNLGFGKAQNLGFAKEPAKFYLALNPDIIFIPKERTLEKMIQFMNNNPKVGITGPKLLNLDNTIQYSCNRFPALFDQIIRRLNLDKKFSYCKKRVDYYLMRDFNHNQTIKVDWLMGSFILARKEMVEQIGFFDDRYFMYFEDCDWCRRAWQANWQVFYLTNVVAWHSHRRESVDASPWVSLFKNPVARIHIKSWMKYFFKWGLEKTHYGA